MKRIILVLVLILVPISTFASDEYYINGKRYDKLGDTWFNNDYRNPVTYKVNGNHITGSDGSSYTIYGQQEIQDNNTGKSYIINGNTIRPMH